MSQRVVRLSGAKLFPSHPIIVDPGVEDWRTLVAELAAGARLAVLGGVS
jgi:hypothetical protein